MLSKNSKQNNQKRTRRQKKGNRPPPRDNMMVVPKNMGFVMPDRLRTHLRFWKSGAFDLSVSGVASVRYTPTAAFDVDPDIGSTAMAGFVELAQFYRSYRVRGSSIKVEVANTSPDSIVNCTVLPLNADPGASPTGTLIITARENPYAKNKTCPPLGGPITRLSSYMSTQKMFGNPMTEYDDSFASLVTTTPVNNWFWWISVYSLASIPVSDPVLWNVFIEVEIDFFDRAFLIRS